MTNKEHLTKLEQATNVRNIIPKIKEAIIRYGAVDGLSIIDEAVLGGPNNQLENLSEEFGVSMTVIYRALDELIYEGSYTKEIKTMTKQQIISLIEKKVAYHERIAGRIEREQPTSRQLDHHEGAAMALLSILEDIHTIEQGC